jgi:hypothetical protein
VRFELKVQESSKQLAALAIDAETFSRTIAGMLRSDDGKRLAANPVTFMAFLKIHEEPAVTPQDIQRRQLAAASILDSLKEERKLLDVGFLPSPKLFDEVDQLHHWVADRQARLSAQKSTLGVLLTSAPKLEEPEKAATMMDAIVQYRARWHKLLAESRIWGEQQAKPEVGKILVDGSRLAKLEQARAEREKILTDTRAEVERLKLEQNLRLLEAEKVAEIQRFKVEKDYQDALAELERLRSQAEADREEKNADVQIAIDAQQNATRRRQAVALIKSPEVRRLLGPFYGIGYWQPGIPGGTMKPGPMSLSKIKAFGALHNDEKAFYLLNQLAISPRNAGRPRWSRRRRPVRWSPQDRQELYRAHELLRTYGDLMVEEGLLAP